VENESGWIEFEREENHLGLDLVLRNCIENLRKVANFIVRSTRRSKQVRPENSESRSPLKNQNHPQNRMLQSTNSPIFFSQN
jgi:hypothetical protein